MAIEVVLIGLAFALPASAAEALSPEKPVLELLFDDDLTDTSGSREAGTANGTVRFVDGRRGRCASFDGRTWIDTRFDQQDLGNEFTVECWVNPADHQNAHANIFGNHVSDGLGFVLQQNGTQANQFYAAYGAGQQKWVLTDPVTLAAGRWQHVALVKTGEDLRIYLNGILVSAKKETTPALPSPMPVAVGLGYSDAGRCFRGLIDEFRIWNRALTDFAHAGIDPADAQETLAQCLHAAPRPVAGPLEESWTIATDDTRITLGITVAGECSIAELACPRTGWNWITRPVAIRLWPQVTVDRKSRSISWRFVKADIDQSEGQELTLTFTCDNPRLRVESCWHASKGLGPVRHRMIVVNESDQSVTIGEQATFDLDLTGGETMWAFHSDGITPDPVGIYRYPLSGEATEDRHTVRTSPGGQFIPYVVFDAQGKHGLYLGMQWSFCRIETVALDDNEAVRVRAGNVADLRAELAPGESLEVRPGFLGTYCGDLDDAANRLRRWLWLHNVPEILREDPGYPKVQWNAFGATGKSPGSWDPVESKYYPLIDDIAPLGFEEVMIDVAWWQGAEPDSDEVDWSSGMKKAADYAHGKGMRFGLYWTDDLDMASAAGRQQRAARIRRLFDEYDADMWRSDCTRGEVIGTSYEATRGFYETIDALAQEIPGFQWENCSGGGRIKDYGAMRRAVKIFNSDTYSALHVRQAFYDSSYAMHPVQLEGHLGSTDGRYRPHGVKEMRYAFRSTSMGAPEWFLDAPNGGNGSEPWSGQEKEALKACVETYKKRIRPLVRNADLYHILPRPDGINRDAIEYYDPISGKGLICLFQPSKQAVDEPIRLKGLKADRQYRLTFEDGSNPSCVRSGKVLMEEGLSVCLEGDRVSEWVFFEAAQ